MSGDKTIKLRNREFRLFYIPIALEIFIGFIPVLMLGSWYIGRLVKELIDYESGLTWITLQQMVEKEYFELRGLENDEQLAKLDLANVYGGNSLFLHHRDVFGSVVSGVEEIETVDDADEIQIKYIVYGNDGKLYEVDAENRRMTVIPESDKYYGHIIGIIEGADNQEVRMRSYYQFDRKRYYEVLEILIPTKPVYYRDRMLSDGLEGSCVLVCGQIPSYATEQNAEYFRLRVHSIFFVIVALICGLVCFAVFRSSRELMKIMGLMEAVCKDDVAFPNITTRLLDEGEAPRIKDLIENFQIMLLSIQKYQASISSIRESYESLLPATFLALFHREDIREIKPGDKAVVRGKVLSVRFVPSSEKRRESLSGRNELISRILEILASANMIVTQLEYDKISALWVQDNEAKSPVSEKIAVQIRTLDRNESGVDDIIVTDTEGEFCYTVTGAPGHMAIRMEQISEEVQDKKEI